MRLRVLVVDDSTLMRRIIGDILRSDPTLEVVAEAPDGPTAIRLIHELRPDVVTLDIEMPGLSGLEVLGYLMAEQPTPVVMLTGLNDPDLAMQALSLGAVEFLRKPSGTISMDLYKIQEELVHKVKMAPLANLRQVERRLDREEWPCSKRPPPQPRPTFGQEPDWIVVVGASTGGPPALEQLLAALPAELPAGLLVVQHMPVGFTHSLAQRLNGRCVLTVVEAEPGMPLYAAWVYIAPGGHHLVLRAEGTAETLSVELDDSPPRGTLRPAADVTMAAVAERFGPRCIGVLLTGMGSDGTEGFRAIRQAGGRTLAQDRQTSLIYGMPRMAVEQGLVDQVLPLNDIAPALVRLLEET
ncbi:MAG: chemotaxis response regulator protein-glutamate methylesterase [Chloroflexia bacterium]|nr:chemotaxis response regulator protein-glutamate methylesterase [Chloroflexia bacterium]